MSRAVKVTRGNVVRGKVARGYVAARYCRRGSVARGNVRAVVSCYEDLHLKYNSKKTVVLSTEKNYLFFPFDVIFS